MPRWRHWIARVVLLGAMAGLAACAGPPSPLSREGATPGTLPEGTAPNGLLPNGLTPEPWGDTS